MRATRRQHESSVRMALGAGRWSLVRQFLAESLTLAGAGCAAGLAVGFVLMRLLVWLAPQNIPRIQNVSMDWQVFAAAAAVSVHGCSRTPMMAASHGLSCFSRPVNFLVTPELVLG